MEQRSLKDEVLAVIESIDFPLQAVYGSGVPVKETLHRDDITLLGEMPTVSLIITQDAVPEALLNQLTSKLETNLQNVIVSRTENTLTVTPLSKK